MDASVLRGIEDHVLRTNFVFAAGHGRWDGDGRERGGVNAVDDAVEEREAAMASISADVMACALDAGSVPSTGGSARPLLLCS